MTKAHSLDFCCPDLQALLWHGLLLASDSNGQKVEDGPEDGENTNGLGEIDGVMISLGTPSKEGLGNMYSSTSFHDELGDQLLSFGTDDGSLCRDDGAGLLPIGPDIGDGDGDGDGIMTTGSTTSTNTQP